MPRKTYGVCPVPGCPELLDPGQTQCARGHGRPKGNWSRDRDNAAHLRQRRQLIKERGPVCERCGWTTTPDGRGLQMHHVSPTDVLLLCRTCHQAVDPHAR